MKLLNSWTIGFRCPWTTEDEMNTYRTHQRRERRWLRRRRRCRQLVKGHVAHSLFGRPQQLASPALRTRPPTRWQWRSEPFSGLALWSLLRSSWTTLARQRRARSQSWRIRIGFPVHRLGGCGSMCFQSGKPLNKNWEKSTDQTLRWINRDYIKDMASFFFYERFFCICLSRNGSTNM